MRLLNDNTETDICEAKFHKLITKEDRMSELFNQLDKLMFTFSSYVMRDDGFCGDRNSPEELNLWAIKTFRDLFITEDQEP